METIELQNDNGPDYRFQGEKLTEVSSRNLINDGGRWTELSLYRTNSGTLVAHEVGVTNWEGEHDRYTVHVAADDRELVAALGYGRLAKELYAEAGIDHAQDIA